MPVFVLDADRKPLTPCHSAVARKLLATGKAALLRYRPLTIILKRGADTGNTERLRLKIDPGSRVTGMAVVNDRTGGVVFAAEVEHRGHRIKAALDDRRALRRRRRSRKTRYREPRFANRRRTERWLSPSLASRVANVKTWVNRLRRLSPIGAISVELAKFDTQALVNPEVTGEEYQQGELAGYEVREYLLQKWDRQCAYCGVANVPVEVEHIVARSRGGTDRVSNLTLACQPCNQAKGNRPVEEFLDGKPERSAAILAQARAPLRDAGVINAIRWRLFRSLKAMELPVETGTGGRTKYNRTRRGLPKGHWLDAACVGASTPGTLLVEGVRPLVVRALGHGRRRRCLPNRYGFPRGHATRAKGFFGFETGDLVRAVVPRGRHTGTHVGRVAVRKSGSFLVGKADGIRWNHCHLLQRGDGYDYAEREASACFPQGGSDRRRAGET